MMTIKLELRTFHYTAEKDAAIIKAVRAMAKDLITRAAWLQDKYPAEITLQIGEMTASGPEIMLFDDEGNELDAVASEEQVVVRPKRGLERLDLNRKEIGTDEQD